MKKRVLIIGVVVFAMVTVVITLILLYQTGNIGNREPSEKHKVTFLNSDGSIMTEAEVKDGYPAPCPGIPELLPGEVFSGWDTDLQSVKSDITTKALVQNIIGKSNVFALYSYYGTVEDKVLLPLQLCGKVDLNCFELQISYDNHALEFLGIDNCDSAVLFNDNREKGIVYLNYISTNATLGEIDLGVLSFHPIHPSVGEVKLNANSVAKADDEEKYESVDYEVIDATVTIVEPVNEKQG